MPGSMIEKLEAFLQTDPEDTFTKFALALEYQKIGQIEKSKTLFEQITKSDPNYVGTYYHLGKLYFQLGKTEKAVKVFRSGIEVAKSAGDHHALSELQTALMELEVDDE